LSDIRVRYVKQDNAGVSAARNFGASLAKNEIISFLDSDDLWKPEKLQHEVDFLKSHKNIKVVFTDLEAQRGDDFIHSFMQDTRVFSKLISKMNCGEEMVLSKREMYLILLNEVPIKPTSFSIYRKLFKESGKFDLTHVSGEDWEYFLRLSRVENFGYIHKPLAVLRLSADSLHILQIDSDFKSVIGFLTNSKKSIVDDVEAYKAACSGIKNAYLYMNRHYLLMGFKLKSFKLCLRGYFATYDFEFLLRAGAVFFPKIIQLKSRKVLRRLIRG